jgi:hypothetical protein
VILCAIGYPSCMFISSASSYLRGLLRDCTEIHVICTHLNHLWHTGNAYDAELISIDPCKCLSFIATGLFSYMFDNQHIDLM